MDDVAIDDILSHRWPTSECDATNQPDNCSLDLFLFFLLTRVQVCVHLFLHFTRSDVWTRSSVEDTHTSITRWKSPKRWVRTKESVECSRRRRVKKRHKYRQLFCAVQLSHSLKVATDTPTYAIGWHRMTLTCLCPLPLSLSPNIIMEHQTGANASQRHGCNHGRSSPSHRRIRICWHPIP